MGVDGVDVGILTCVEDSQICGIPAHTHPATYEPLLVTFARWFTVAKSPRKGSSRYLTKGSLKAAPCAVVLRGSEFWVW